MSKEKIGAILLIIVAISWGGTFLPVSLAIKFANVPSFLAWRFLLAALLMWLCLFKRVKFDPHSIKFGLILGAFLFCDFTLQTYALNYIYSSTTAFIIGLNIVFVPFISYALLRQKIDFFAFISVSMAAFGLYLLSATKSVGFSIGELLALVSAVCYALHIVVTGIIVKRANIPTLVVTQLLSMSALSFCTAIFFTDSKDGLMGGLEYSFEPIFLITLVVCALVATVFAFVVQSYAQRYVSSEKTALIFALEPVSAGFIGYFIGGEMLSFTQILGALLILFGILLSEFGLKIFKIKKYLFKHGKSA